MQCAHPAFSFFHLSKSFSPRGEKKSCSFAALWETEGKGEIKRQHDRSLFQSPRRPQTTREEEGLTCQ